MRFTTHQGRERFFEAASASAARSAFGPEALAIVQIEDRTDYRRTEASGVLSSWLAFAMKSERSCSVRR